MTLIKKISPNSRNGDLSALLTLILNAFAKNDWSADIYLTPILEHIRVVNTALIEAIKRLIIYSQMADQDHVRDMEIRNLFKLVAGYIHIPLIELKEAALLVNTILKQYGLGIQKGDYSEESAEIESLLNDLSKPDVLIAIAKLQGVPETIAALDKAQKDFENMALKQAEGASAKKNLASASTLKYEIITEINDNLVGYMNTMAKVNPVTFGDTSQTIAELIHKNNELVKRRHKTDEPDTKLV